MLLVSIPRSDEDRTEQVEASWIYERTRRGGKDTIPHVRVGKYIRFPEELVRAFIEQHKAKGNTERAVHSCFMC